MPRSAKVNIVAAPAANLRLKTQAGSSGNFHRKYHAPFIHFEKIYICPRERLCEHARAASLNGLHLGLSPGETAETGGQLSAVKELAGLGLDGAQRGTGGAADAAIEGRATEGAVLLSLSTVSGEGVRESSGGRGGVDARRVVNGLGDRALSNEANERSARSAAEDGSDTHGGSYVVVICVKVVRLARSI
jgi:hypothetical protein